MIIMGYANKASDNKVDPGKGECSWKTSFISAKFWASVVNLMFRVMGYVGNGASADTHNQIHSTLYYAVYTFFIIFSNWYIYIYIYELLLLLDIQFYSVWHVNQRPSLRYAMLMRPSLSMFIWMKIYAHWVSIHLANGRLTARSREVSKPQN